MKSHSRSLSSSPPSPADDQRHVVLLRQCEEHPPPHDPDLDEAINSAVPGRQVRLVLPAEHSDAVHGVAAAAAAVAALARAHTVSHVLWRGQALIGRKGMVGG